MPIPISTKAQTGLSIAFPDVCMMPNPPIGPQGIPCPYPGIATTAARVQQKKKTGGQKVTRMSGFMHGSGNEAGTMKSAVSFNTVNLRLNQLGEITRLRGGLNTAHAKLQGLATSDPDQWQAVLQDYLVLASALYLAQHNDDD